MHRQRQRRKKKLQLFFKSFLLLVSPSLNLSPPASPSPHISLSLLYPFILTVYELARESVPQSLARGDAAIREVITLNAAYSEFPAAADAI